MATREHRLAEFNNGPPVADLPLQVLCEDHNGTYLLPYLCRWVSGVWMNCGSGETIAADVVGWRHPPLPRNDPKSDA
ncbi:MAG: hypothetical protein GC182_17000 [Rhodopseudomonas sp.]|nr:hypothetical protein [Rhodopseudomonas sp.]